jgi:hypothetical protein
MEDSRYYRDTYELDIWKDSIVANEANLKIMLNDPKHRFGVGYILAAILQDIDLIHPR